METIKLNKLLSDLEKVGFLNYLTRRLGPCWQCSETLQTYFIPSKRAWICASCFYDPSNDWFISWVNHEFSENIMATVGSVTLTTEQYNQLMARLGMLEGKVKQSEANVYISRNGNLTLKWRKDAPRSWVIPSKRNDGKVFIRGADIPGALVLDPSNTKIILHAELPVDGDEAKLFTDRFANQTVVAPQRAQGTAPAQSAGGLPTSSAPTPQPPAQPVTQAQATVAPAGYDQDALIKDAQGLVDAGLYKSLIEAVNAVKKSRGIK